MLAPGRHPHDIAGDDPAGLVTAEVERRGARPDDNHLGGRVAVGLLSLARRKIDEDDRYLRAVLGSGVPGDRRARLVEHPRQPGVAIDVTVQRMRLSRSRFNLSTNSGPTIAACALREERYARPDVGICCMRRTSAVQ